MFSQFLKDGSSSEIAALKNINGIDIFLCDRTFGFVFQMQEEEKMQAKRCYLDFFRLVIEKARSGYDMVILDEILGMIEVGFLEKEVLATFLKDKPEHLELVCTGRNPDQLFHDYADYITVMQKEKHPFDRGLAAREGIEY